MSVPTRALFDKGPDAKSCNSALGTFRGSVVLLPSTPSVHGISTQGHEVDAVSLTVLN